MATLYERLQKEYNAERQQAIVDEFAENPLVQDARNGVSLGSAAEALDAYAWRRLVHRDETLDGRLRAARELFATAPRWELLLTDAMAGIGSATWFGRWIYENTGNLPVTLLFGAMGGLTVYCALYDLLDDTKAQRYIVENAIRTSANAQQPENVYQFPQA